MFLKIDVTNRKPLDTLILERVEVATTLDSLQAAVGGLIEAAFTIPSKSRKGYAITAYVNEEGLLYGLPIRVALLHGPRPSPISPLAGNVAITGLSPDGESVDLTREEITQVTSMMSGNVRRVGGFPTLVVEFLL